MKLKGFILVGLTALILYGCNSKTETSNCLGVTTTNVIEVQDMMDSVDSYLETLSAGALTENIFNRENELVFEAMDNVNLVVNTDEDQDFKNGYLKWRGHVIDIVYGYQHYVEYQDQDDMEKAQNAIMSLGEFNSKFETVKQYCN